MHLRNCLARVLLAVPQLISACTHGLLPLQTESDITRNVTYPISELGSDTPSDHSTLGYFINHLCMKVRNATESVEWYGKVFGLRHIFTQQVSKHFSISYMGYSSGGRNGTGFQTAMEMNRDKSNRYGMVELTSLNGIGWNVEGTSNGLHHIGLIVPDIEALQKRLEEVVAEVVKAFGEAPAVDLLAYQEIGVLDQAEQDLIFANIKDSNSPLVWVRDPSGNLIEVQGQEGFGLID
jgi:lactoylglutathione lyase